MYEPCDTKGLKTLLAIERGDTIVAVSRKIDENRETVRRVVNRLEDAGYVTYTDGLSVVDDAVREAGLSFLAASAAVSPPSIADAYVLPHFGGMNFAYTRIDAVYVWTRGGYQVARDPDDYPLFIAVEEADVDEWTEFFDRFGIPVATERQPVTAVDGPLQIVINARDEIEWSVVDGRPVVPLAETVAFARDHYATFQSALAILARMYDEVDDHDAEAIPS